MFRTVIIASAVVAAVTAQCPSVPDGGCSICGDGECVQAPDVVFIFPGQPSVPCGMLQDAGFNGQIPLDQCPVLPTLVNNACDCGVPPPPTPAPIATPAPIPPTPEGSCPGIAIASSGCSICGDGLCVQNPNAIFEFPDQPSVACGTLESAGASGLIPLGDCVALPSFIAVCQCGIPAAPPTPAPIQPTPQPVQPTPQPVNPTLAPVVIDPTPQPVEPTVPPVQPTPQPVNPTLQPVDPTLQPVQPTPAPTNAPLPPTLHPIAIYVPPPLVDNSLFSRGGAGMGVVGTIQMQMTARETTVAMTMAIQQRRRRRVEETNNGGNNVRGAN